MIDRSMDTTAQLLRRLIRETAGDPLTTGTRAGRLGRIANAERDLSRLYLMLHDLYAEAVGTPPGQGLDMVKREISDLERAIALADAELEEMRAGLRR